MVGDCVSPAPDWQKRRVFLVDPAIWSRYKRGSTALRPIYQEVMAVLHGWGAEVDLLGHVSDPLDIWIRDWGCVEGVFFRYAPDYAKGLYSRAAVARAMIGLNAHLPGPFHLRLAPLVLDGGNLIHNGTVAATDGSSCSIGSRMRPSWCPLIHGNQRRPEPSSYEPPRVRGYFLS